MPHRSHILISGDPISLARNAEAIKAAFDAELAFYALTAEVAVAFTGDLRVPPAQLPAAIVYPEGVVYGPLTTNDAPLIVSEHLYKGRVVDALRVITKPLTGAIVRVPAREGALFAQQRVVLARAGIINPESIEDYIAHDGYAALGKALTEMTPAQVVQEIIDAGVQGRGGAGFPIGMKLKIVAEANEFAATQAQSRPSLAGNSVRAGGLGDVVAATSSRPKYVLCNADESEPGTFKDRLIIEGDPHSIIEGMLISGYAIGARKGYIYLRGEYVQARERLEKAIAQAHAFGLLGEKIFGSDFSFEIHIHSGAGAYICGEETALIESLEGKRGEPRIRPPYPTTYGIWGNPTAVNNVESLANLPPIIRKGAAWYRTIGTAKCPGTKVYTMLGDVNVTGLIEVPMGTTLRTVIEVYGGGMKRGKRFKLAQTGGTAGAIIDASFLDVPMDFAELAARGAGLGSGALLICGDDTCVVDLAYVLLRFFANESCGKCVPCRLGTTRAMEILARLKDARATMDDLAQLERIATQMQVASFCGLGQAAAVPILTGLRFFRDEFVAHADARKCAANVCALRGEPVIVKTRRVVPVAA
ncbi:MAG: NADH-ubiquinone oxidoreductase-F iron-sulfur binding region domain-containing protein [Chloroflexota bacterium]